MMAEEPIGYTLSETAYHAVAARQSPSSGLWMPSCTCGWCAPPCITTEEVEAVGAAHYRSAADAPSRAALVDVGPATPPPSWCAPDTEPDWMDRTASAGGGQVCVWNHAVGNGDVWIGCDDQVIGGRVLRSEPRIFGTDEPTIGWTAGQARELAVQLVAGADLIDAAVTR